jgi:phosphoribosylamine---glycine ligase
MRVLIVGSGGREHALTWKLAQNPMVDKLFAVPGNPGMAAVAECLDASVDDHETLGNLAEDLGVDLVVIGPEAPLVAGAVDALSERGLKVFGPTRAAARIEGSKSFAKQILTTAGAPTASSQSFDDAPAAIAHLDSMEPPYVIAVDGLAAGKGVVIAADRAEAVSAIEDALVARRFGDAGARILIQEYLQGEEASLLCLTDGRDVLPLALAQDYKRIGDDDAGPNTGGMGAYSPVAHLDITDRVVRDIAQPVVAAMAAEGAPFKGLLYTQVMVTAEGPKLIEFNCRFGDPETQVVLPRLASDLTELLLACVEGNLGHFTPSWRPQACVSVVLASGGYPGSYETGKPITGLDAASALDGVVVFHAGTATRDGRVVTNGGRVLNVSALGRDLAQARERAYEAAALIDFEGKYCRTDIASNRGGTA